MKVKQIVGGLLLAAGVTYGIIKAAPVLSELSSHLTSFVGLILLFTLLILAMVRVLKS